MLSVRYGRYVSEINDLKVKESCIVLHIRQSVSAVCVFTQLTAHGYQADLTVANLPLPNLTIADPSVECGLRRG